MSSRREPPEGYVSGPEAATEATARALPSARAAKVVVLVEGVSDQIAVDTFLRTTGRALDGTAVLPTGGAHGMARHAGMLAGTERRLVAMCDAREAPIVRDGLERAAIDVPLIVCDRDLEDELIGSLTPERVVAVVEANGDLRALRTMQGQGVWAGRPLGDQLRRFLGAGATRKSRYAELLVREAVASSRVPPPFRQLLDHLER